MFNLGSGVESISGLQEILFTQYVKVILPLDGFVFWVKADLLSHSALTGGLLYNSNSALFNSAVEIKKPALTILAKGSLHVASQKIQDENDTYGVNKVTFTSEDPIDQDFNEISDTTIYIGTFGQLKFAFSTRENFYRQAGIWHYVGDAIYPYMESQIIDSPADLNTKELIVSNSLPLWLHLNNYIPMLPSYGFGNPIPLYPSSLVSPNIRPPFASVHIFPESLQGLASTPFLGFRLSHHQLVRERVKIVFYGVGNDRIMDFVDCVNQYSSDYDLLGILNVPAMRDEKVRQSELGIIAQKKSIEYEISYRQNSVRDIARQIIGQAIPSVITIPPVFFSKASVSLNS